MKMTKQDIIKAMKTYNLWLDSLLELSEEQATTPYQPGKWSAKQIVMHLAEWDRFTFEERLPNMKQGAKLERFPEFEKFNADAAVFSNNYTFEETVVYAKSERLRILQKLEQLDELEWDKEFYIGEHVLSIKNYFADFTEHDEHHKRQIESIRGN